MVANQLNVSHQQEMKPLQCVRGRLANGCDISQQASGNQIQHRFQHLVFAPVMTINGRRHDTDFPGQRPDAQMIQPVPGNQDQRCPGNLFLAYFGLDILGSPVHICL
jgi:hypothetical protein